MTENLDANEVRREVVRTAVGELRTKLLDLTGRNRLLNFRHAERGRQVRIVGADLLGIYAQLITGTPIELRPLPEPSREYNENEDVAAELEVLRDNDAIYLASIEAAEDDSKLLAEAEAELARRHGIKATRHKSVVVDVARAAGIDPGFDLEIGTQTESRTRTKSSLQTLLLPDVYDRRLSQVRDDARSALQELGINTLNCTLSFLEWYEDDNSRKVILSPLVLVPLAIDRVVERSKYVYRVNGIGEDAETNVTLAERLRRDFSILLPKYDVDQALDTYLDLIRDAIKDKPT